MLPNLISILRLFLVPLIVAFILDGDWDLALYGFLLAGISDAV
ncbi:MAG: CDP-alcohol phosphatidyltransferase family protein, partial [Alphaproteobacteria bacterium]|nr:CDP-alcohol phosphatidyltransferase family protein [Alphaproteobacteria bacterium]